MYNILSAIADYFDESFENCDSAGWEFTAHPSPSYIFELNWGNGSYLARFTTHFLHKFESHDIVDALEAYDLTRWMQENMNTIVHVSTQGVHIIEDDE